MRKRGRCIGSSGTYPNSGEREIWSCIETRGSVYLDEQGNSEIDKQFC